MMNAIGIALSGLNAATQKVSAAASNIANAFTSGSLEDAQHAPYTPVTAVAQTQGNGGVSTTMVPHKPAFIPAYDPDSPLANANGEVGVPTVELGEEFVNLKVAEISYKANLKTIQAQTHLEDELLKLFDEKV